jgi:polysaccharide pyruvyl transferase WcaK-like protein
MKDDPPITSKPLRIAVFGFYGNENLGDEAIIAAVIANMRDVIPAAELQCISVNPVDSTDRHSVRADSIFVPVAHYKSQREKIASQQSTRPDPDLAADTGGSEASLRDRLKSLALLRAAVSFARFILRLPSTLRSHLQFARHIRDVVHRTDAILISGSNQFLDNFGGPSAFPYTLWMWSRIAKQNNVPVIVLCVGAGPILSKLSMRLIQGTIGRTAYLSLRDTGSAEVLGLDPTTTNIRPDLAFSHPSDTVRTALNRDFVLDAAPVIAINPMAVHARGYWHEVNDEKYAALVGKLCRLVRHLESVENEFIFLSNQPRDDLVIEDVIAAAVEQGSSRSELESRFLPSTTVEEYLANASKADIIIATRFHATVLSLLLARPTIGLCYHRKSAELLRGFSLGEHAFDMDEFSPEDVIGSIRTLTDDYTSNARTIAARVQDFRKQLNAQYRDVERLLTKTNAQ